jgi:rubrerythrin
MNNCPILGCNILFADKEDAELHSANSWHCIACGYSDDRELTNENLAELCPMCSEQTMEEL